jgi:hypothetical protein
MAGDAREWSESYCIEWRDERPLHPDGGAADPLLETRERLVRVEASQEKMRSSISRIESKVDETNEMIQEVEDESLSQGRFEREYEATIQRASKYISLIKWLGFLLVVAVAVLELAGALGYQPLAP